MVGVVLVSVPVAWAADVEAKVQSVDDSGQCVTLDTGLKLMIPANVKVDRKALQPGTPFMLSYDFHPHLHSFPTRRSSDLATDNNTVGMGDAGIKSAIQGSNVPNPDEAVPSFVSGAMAKAGKGLLEGTLQAGTSAVSDKLLDLVGLGGKSAADKGKDTR